MVDLYLYACGVGVLILLSWVGWGWLLSLSSPKTDYSFGMLGVFGTSFTIIVGGFLNLFTLISPFSIRLYMCAGLTLFLLYMWTSRRRIMEEIQSFFSVLKSNKLLVIPVLLLVLFLCARIALSVSYYSFHGADDEPGYLTFSAKMIQTGSLGDDPFSERRLVSSLGGKYFLDTFVLTFVNYKYLHLVDNCISYSIYIFLVYGIVRSIRIERYLKMLILTLPILIASPTFNVTSVITSMMLLLGLFIIVARPKKTFGEIFVLVPVITAALIASKSNVIVPVFFVVAYYYFLVIESNLKQISFSKLRNSIFQVIQYVLVPGLLIILFLTPWAISMYHSSGTLFYPLLGRGYHGISYGTFLSHYFSFDFYSFIRLSFELYGGLSLLIPAGILGGVIFYFKVHERRTLLVLLCSALLGVLALIYATGGYSLYYYSFSFMMPVVLFCLIMINDNVDVQQKQKIGVITVIIISFMLGFYVQKGFDVFDEIKRGVSFENGFKFGLFNTNQVSKTQLDQYKHLQDSIPENEVFLAVLEKNFILNFKRNTIYIVDSPGAASFPPGMPMFKGERALSEYLLSKNIKYIACSCGKSAVFSEKAISGMLKVHVNPWLKTEATNLIDFHKNFNELVKQKRTVFNDGTNIVLDISKSR